MSKSMIEWQPINVLAAGTIAAFRFVSYAGIHCAAGVKAMGVSKRAITDATKDTLIAAGIAIVETDGIFAVGDNIVATTAGKAIKATTLAATNTTGAVDVVGDAAQPTIVLAGSTPPEAINGIAIDASTASGEFVRIKLV